MDTISGAGDSAARAVSGGGRGRYRSHSVEEKRRIVEESLTGGASVSIVARRHDMNANQLFTWRRQYAQGRFGPVAVASAAVLLPVRVEEALVGEAPAAKTAASVAAGGWIEIECTRPYRLRVHGAVDRGALRAVLEVLSSR